MNYVTLVIIWLIMEVTRKLKTVGKALAEISVIIISSVRVNENETWLSKIKKNKKMIVWLKNIYYVWQREHSWISTKDGENDGIHFKRKETKWIQIKRTMLMVETSIQ